MEMVQDCIWLSDISKVNDIQNIDSLLKQLICRWIRSDIDTSDSNKNTLQQIQGI